MDVQFIRDRISQLRTNQGISEYKVSYATQLSPEDLVLLVELASRLNAKK